MLNDHHTETDYQQIGSLCMKCGGNRVYYFVVHLIITGFDVILLYQIRGGTYTIKRGHAGAPHRCAEFVKVTHLPTHVPHRCAPLMWGHLSLHSGGLCRQVVRAPVVNLATPVWGG